MVATAGAPTPGGGLSSLPITPGTGLTPTAGDGAGVNATSGLLGSSGFGLQLQQASTGDGGTTVALYLPGLGMLQDVVALQSAVAAVGGDRAPAAGTTQDAVAALAQKPVAVAPQPVQESAPVQIIQQLVAEHGQSHQVGLQQQAQTQQVQPGTVTVVASETGQAPIKSEVTGAQMLEAIGQQVAAAAPKPTAEAVTVDPLVAAAQLPSLAASMPLAEGATAEPTRPVITADEVVEAAAAAMAAAVAAAAQGIVAVSIPPAAAAEPDAAQTAATGDANGSAAAATEAPAADAPAAE